MIYNAEQNCKLTNALTAFNDCNGGGSGDNDGSDCPRQWSVWVSLKGVPKAC